MTRQTFLLIAIWVLVPGSLRADDSPLRVVKDSGDRPTAIEAVGWSKEELAKLASLDAETIARWQQRLGIHVLNENGQPQHPAISGSYRIIDDALRFTPQFPLRPGVSYEAFLRPTARRAADSPAVYTLKISIPAPPPAPPTRVTAIYPSANTLPENQLRFYIHFSAPMAAGDAYSHVKLMKANGQVVDRAFLEVSGELWDSSGQRLTVLLDPGRVKKGLQPRQELGPVLEAGQTYRLVIDNAWRDANNQPLAAAFEKKFVAGPPVETAVQFQEWKIDVPAPGTRLLTIRFPRPLDHALLLRMITVADAAGKPIEGEVSVGDEERRWEFRATQAWVEGQFTLVVDKALEDSAGNNLARAFEVDVFDRVDDKPGPDFVRIPFTVAKK